MLRRPLAKKTRFLVEGLREMLLLLKVQVRLGISSEDPKVKLVCKKI